MSIKNWASEDRPREKLLQRGAWALTDAELLAIFLRTGTHGKSAVDLARDLLADFGSLKALLHADHVRFCQANGLGNAKYAQLQAVLEMAKRHFNEVLQRDSVLTSPEITKAYLSAQLRGYEHEVFAGLFLDSQYRVLQWQELFSGTLDASSVYPREIAKRALLLNASAIIVAHNHPSGITAPSLADTQLTHTLKHALALLDITLLDHFIIGDGAPYSFAEQGLL